jgi:outer membrane lipoprotein-sorting protein
MYPKIIPIRFQRITRRQGRGDEAYFIYVEEADDAANKVSQRKRIGIILVPRIMFLFLLSGLICGCLQRTITHLDVPSEKHITAISGAVTQDKTLSALAQIDLVTKQGYQQVKAALVIKKPSYLRLELLPIIGTPDFFLVATPVQMAIFIPSRGEYYRGKPTGANLAKFLSWDFSIEDIVTIFSGTYPSLPEKEVSSQSYQEGNFLRIEMKAKSGRSQTIWIGEKNRLSKYIRNDESGKEIYQVQYDDYEPESIIAGKITIKMADGITSISVKYSGLKIETSADLSIFEMPTPEGIKTIFLD